MSRAHELSRQMSEERDYSDRLSEGLPKAWDEAEENEDGNRETEPSAEDLTQTAADGLEGTEHDGEKKEVARLQAFKLINDDSDLSAITVEEAKSRLEMPRGIEVERVNHGRWTVSVNWRGEELYSDRVATLEEAARVCEEIAWPIAHRLDRLDEAAKQVPRFADASATIASRFQREVGPTLRLTDEHQLFLFAEEETREVVHVTLEKCLTDAIRDLHREGIFQDDLEVWHSNEPGLLLEGLEVFEDGVTELGDPVEDFNHADLLKRYRAEPQQDESNPSSQPVPEGIPGTAGRPVDRRPAPGADLSNDEPFQPQPPGGLPGNQPSS